jgi:hypothetical protein
MLLLNLLAAVLLALNMKVLHKNFADTLYNNDPFPHKVHETVKAEFVIAIPKDVKSFYNNRNLVLYSTKRKAINLTETEAQ